MTNIIHSFKLNDDGSFSENEVTDVKEKATELKRKFGELVIDVVNEIIGAIEHEDNVMYYEIKFWNDVKDVLKG
jgi:siderophore synthetase component